MKKLHKKEEVPTLWQIFKYVLIGTFKNLLIIFGVGLFAYILIEIFEIFK
jgi:hypothetical protein